MEFLTRKLAERQQNGTLRTLFVPDGLVDFASNDYLGFARWVGKGETMRGFGGATGSRLISGNTAQAEALEAQIATFHGAEAGLLFNSGYDANVGLLACLAGEHDVYLCDELIHASMIDGTRLSKATKIRFKHNDMQDLAQKLVFAKEQTKAKNGNVLICVESVYSMDGDMASLKAMADLACLHGAYLIVDEAHATGIVGKGGEGLVQHLGLEKQVLARVHTFGKALGAHGAVVLGSAVLKAYLVNFARSFIYSTALPAHSLSAIALAYQACESPRFQTERTKLFENIATYKRLAKDLAYPALQSATAIQGIVIRDASKAKEMQKDLQEAGIYVKAILSPTVPEGTERLRICLHSYNTLEELEKLFAILHKKNV